MSFQETLLKVTKNDVDLKLVFIVLYFKKLILNSLYNYQKPLRRPEKFIGRMRKKWLGNEGERSLWGNESFFFFSSFFSFYFLPPGGVGEHFIWRGGQLPWRSMHGRVAGTTTLPWWLRRDFSWVRSSGTDGVHAWTCGWDHRDGTSPE